METNQYISPDINAGEKQKTRNTVQIATLVLGIMILVLLVTILGLSIFKKTTTQINTKNPNPTTLQKTQATQEQITAYKNYLVTNKFEGPNTLNGFTTVNGIYTGSTNSGFNILTTQGNQFFSANPNTLFTSQVLAPDGSGNQTFEPGPSYFFTDFTNKVPLGTVIQVVYDTNNSNRPSKIDIYLNQKVK